MMLVIQGTDAEAAKALEDMVPKLLGLAAGGEVTLPGNEKVKGQTIHSLPGDGLALGAPLLFARQGAVLVLGQDRDAIAEALNGGAKNQGLLSDPMVADTLKRIDGPVVLGICSLRHTLPDLPSWAGFRRTTSFDASQAVPGPGVPPSGAKPGLMGEEKFAQELSKMLAPLPPALFTLARQPNAITLEVRQPALKSVSAKLINAAIDSSLGQAADSFKAGPAPGAARVVVPAPPAVPPVPTVPPK